VTIVRLRSGHAYVIDDEDRDRLRAATYPVELEASWTAGDGTEKHGTVKIDPGEIKSFDWAARTSLDPWRNTKL
jgi:hypothetical protein